MTGALRILIVDDDVVDRKFIKRQLSETGLDIVTEEIGSAEEGLTMMEANAFDCVLLDFELPEMNGIEFLVRQRQHAETPAPAVIMLTGSGNERLAVQAMRNGVQDYLVKDEISPSQLELAVRHAVDTTVRQKQEDAESRQLKELAMIDPTTRIGNRNLFNIHLEHAVSRAHRENQRICLLYMDLDGFKDVNDSRGHSAGDKVLAEVARRLMETARDADTVARLGGDEFAVIMETSVSEAGARRLANRIQEVLPQPIQLTDGSVSVGVSVGIAQFPQDAGTADGLLCAADSAMYEAKRNNQPYRFVTPHDSGKQGTG